MAQTQVKRKYNLSLSKQGIPSTSGEKKIKLQVKRNGPGQYIAKNNFTESNNINIISEVAVHPAKEQVLPQYTETEDSILYSMLYKPSSDNYGIITTVADIHEANLVGDKTTSHTQSDICEIVGCSNNEADQNNSTTNMIYSSVLPCQRPGGKNLALLSQMVDKLDAFNEKIFSQDQEHQITENGLDFDAPKKMVATMLETASKLLSKFSAELKSETSALAEAEQSVQQRRQKVQALSGSIDYLEGVIRNLSSV